MGFKDKARKKIKMLEGKYHLNRVPPDLMDENDREYYNKHPHLRPKPTPVKKYWWQRSWNFKIDLEWVMIILVGIYLLTCSSCKISVHFDDKSEQTTYEQSN